MMQDVQDKQLEPEEKHIIGIDEGYIMLAGAICKMFIDEYKMVCQNVIREQTAYANLLYHSSVMRMLQKNERCNRMKKEAEDNFYAAISFGNMREMLDSIDRMYASCFDYE